MASYKIFVDHLTPEEDLVTEKQKMFETLKGEIKRIHEEQEVALTDLDESFQESLEELKSIREQVESGEDEEIKEAQTKYKDAKANFDSHWAWRAEKNKRVIINWGRWKKFFKWYFLLMLTANIICLIVWMLLSDYLCDLEFSINYIKSL